MLKSASSVNSITGISQRNSNSGSVLCVHFRTNAVSSSQQRKINCIYNSIYLSSFCSTGTRWSFARTFLRPLHVYGVFVSRPFLVPSFVYLSAINTDVTLCVFLYYVLTRYSDLRDKRSKIKRLEKTILTSLKKKKKKNCVLQESKKKVRSMLKSNT